MMRLSNQFPCRICRATFALFMAWIWAGGPRQAAAAPSTQPSPAALVDRLERSLNAIDAAGKEIPRDTFDTKAIVTQVGAEPDALFKWVRDQTDWVPYHGALRGPTGVLMDRLGNSLDRALLVGALLRQAGRHVKLCRGEIPEAQATQFLAKLRPAGADRHAPAAAPKDPFGDAALQRWAAAFQLDLAELREHSRRLAAESERGAEETAGRVADHLPAIAEAVGPGTRPSDRSPNDAVACLADHWWVQYEDGNRWVDLDPLLPDAQPGAALTPVAESLAWDEADANKLPLPEKLCHEVQIRLIVERWDNGRLQQQPVLDHVLRPAETYGELITLNHYPMNWPTDLNLLGEQKAGKALVDAALQQKEWLPILAVGGTQYYQGSFNDGGIVNDKPNLDALKGSGTSAKGAAQAATDLLNTDAPPPAANPGVLTAEWVEYEIRVPGQPTEKVRRDIFDVLGPAVRSAGSVPAAAPTLTQAQRLDRSLATLGAVEILPLTCRLSSEFVVDLATRRMAANRDPLTKLVKGAADGTLKTLPAALENIVPMPGRLYALAQMRHAWNASGDDLYYDRPNILTYRQQLRAAPDSTIRAGEGFDIVANRLAVQRTAKADPFSLRMRQGITDSNVESLLMHSAAAPPTGPAVKSVADRFTAARDKGDAAWVLVRDSKELAAQQKPMPADIRASIQRDLDAGYAVLIPPEGMTDAAGAAWWRVNLATGETLGMNQYGWGGAMVEYAHLILRILLAAYSAYVCLDSVDSNANLDPDQKGWLIGGCLAVATLGIGALAVGSLELTFGGLVGTAGGMIGAAGTYYGRGGKL